MIDGVLTKDLIRHPDERGFFEELIRASDPIFKEGFGQLSRSSMITGVVKAWHVHRTQIDWWYVARGTVKVALFDTRIESFTYRELNEFTLGERGSKCSLSPLVEGLSSKDRCDSKEFDLTNFLKPDSGKCCLAKA